jgi:hypothetical protein
MLLDTGNKNIHVYGLGVGISTVFEIFGHLITEGWESQQLFSKYLGVPV